MTSLCNKDRRALTPLFGNGAGAFRIGKNSVILIKIGKNTKFYALKFLLLDLFNSRGILYFQRLNKQTKQIVNQCNNNRAICLCLIFLSFL